MIKDSTSIDFEGSDTFAPRLSFAFSNAVDLFFVISGSRVALMCER